MQAVANNPEPLINAAIAAIAAQQSAFQAAILSAILIGMAVLIVIGVVVILIKIDRVEKHIGRAAERDNPDTEGKEN